MDLARRLILGSSRVDQWRKEISAVTNMVLGFLSETDGRSIDQSGEVILAESEVHQWTVRYSDKVGWEFLLYHVRPDGAPVLVCTLRGNRPPLEYTGFVHAHLNSFVEGMEKRFPALTQRWRPLTDAVRDEFCMYYELRFSAPSDDSLDLEEGELVKFRKRTDLAFPLPLDTEVFVTLEGTPSTYSSKPITLSGKNLFGEIKIPNNDYGSSFFRVVAHEHEMIDLYGDLSERQFTMILEPLEGWEGVPDKEHFLHLLKVNGWERQD